VWTPRAVVIVAIDIFVVDEAGDASFARGRWRIDVHHE